MDPLVVVSPHLDDAVLSAGQFIASWPGATVATMFAGCPADPIVTTFDMNCGFTDGITAVRSRWHEDDLAVLAVGATAIRCPLLDAQYDPGRDDGIVIGQIRDLVISILVATEAVKLIAPLGIGHPDHVLCSIGCALAATATGIETWTYEEIPYRVLEPPSVPEALDRWRGLGFNPVFDFLGAAPKDRKKQAVAHYTSQLWALDPDVLYVPERLWRQWPV